MLVFNQEWYGLKAGKMDEKRRIVFAALLSLALLSTMLPVLAAPPPEKIVFIHYRAQGAGRPPASEGYYKLLGAKWKKLPVTFVVDPDNPYGLTRREIVDALRAAAEEWDSYTSIELFASYLVAHNANWDGDMPDGRNEIVFESYPEPNVIAVTVIWGYFSGRDKQIIEFDILFNTYYAWGDATIDQNVMDIRNIATHEFGHGVGLADLYQPPAWRETMYGYSDYGETSKRDLYYGDIAGLQKLYGE